MKQITMLLSGWLLIAWGLGRVGFALHPDDLNGLQMVSAHWVHLDLAHAYLNGFGWLLAVIALRRHLLTLLLLVLLAGAAVGAAWVLSDESAAYAGLSGVLYAIGGYVSVSWLVSPRQRLMGAAGLAILGAGLAGAGEAGAGLAFTVAAQAHYVGAATGVLSGLFNARRRFAGLLRRAVPADVW